MSYNNDLNEIEGEIERRCILFLSWRRQHVMWDYEEKYKYQLSSNTEASHQPLVDINTMIISKDLF